MSRFPRLRRRVDEWSDAHERARTRLTERMDGPLGLTEATWLDEHLASCAACSTIAGAYEDDRSALRALRDELPEPPRDLWARTSAGIGAAAGGHRTATGRRLGRRVPIRALSGLTVVAVIAVVSLASGNLLLLGQAPDGVASPDGLGGAPGAASPPGGVDPTPFAVGAGSVGWFDQGPNGGVTHHAVVDEVCPAKAAAGCPALRESQQTALAYQGRPRTLIGSPSRREAVAIAKTADAAGDEIVVVALPDDPDRPSRSAAPTSETPAPETASPSLDTASSAPPASAASAPAESPVSPSASPTLSAEPTVAAQVAIANGIDVVGESAAYSPDGTWFAFTARPADGSGGPDVYVWRVGDERAARVTDDGASYFASWSGNELIASRPDDRGAEDPSTVTVRIDPATHVEADAGDLWRPAVDPTSRLAIAWDGSLERADGVASWSPGRGTLELRRWSEDGPARATGPKQSRIVTDEATADFDVRWDETGEWVAIWVADADDPAIGRLSLYRVDTERGRLEEVDGAPIDASALPGFSMGDGRLAWATPPGQGGEGSRIQIAAWSATGVGIVESDPGEELVVIR